MYYNPKTFHKQKNHFFQLFAEGAFVSSNPGQRKGMTNNGMMKGAKIDLTKPFGSKSLPPESISFSTLTQNILELSIGDRQKIINGVTRGVLGVAGNFLLDVITQKLGYVERSNVEGISSLTNFYDINLRLDIGFEATENVRGLLKSSNYFSTKLELYDTRNSATERKIFRKRRTVSGINQKTITILRSQSFISLHQLQKMLETHKEKIVIDYITRESKKLLKKENNQEKLKTLIRKYKTEKKKKDLRILQECFAQDTEAQDLLKNITKYTSEFENFQNQSWIQNIFKEDDLKEENLLKKNEPNIVNWNYLTLLCLEQQLTITNMQPGVVTETEIWVCRPKPYARSADIRTIGKGFLKQFPDVLEPNGSYCPKPGEYDFLETILTKASHKLEYCEAFHENFEVLKKYKNRTIKGGRIKLTVGEHFGRGINGDRVFINPPLGDPKHIPMSIFYIVVQVGEKGVVEGIPDGYNYIGLGPTELTIDVRTDLSYIHKGNESSLPAVIETRPYKGILDDATPYYNESIEPEILTIPHEKIDMYNTKQGKAEFVLKYKDYENESTVRSLIENLKVNTRGLSPEEIEKMLSNPETHSGEKPKEETEEDE